ncbi:MAG: RsmE family RNA methyltransferase [Candidatus Omnitrophica bacterium]|nr:RsmE family RNA methyltransferase [Candidatus Omnitrophota bacterium]
MNRFFCQASDITGDKIIIGDKEEAHHIKNVLKLKEGERVTVFDEQGNEYACIIAGVGNKIYLGIKNKTASGRKEEKIKLTVACAIPKKSGMDDIVDKLVQLGVYRIIPLKTERTVVKLDKQKAALRLIRWKKIALSASKQSQRNNLAIIEPVKAFDEVIALSSAFDLKLIPHLLGARQGLKEILNSSKPRNNILVLIGPEGDFSDREIDLAMDAGFIPVTLGDLVLRVDTAAIALASCIKLYAHD